MTALVAYAISLAKNAASKGIQLSAASQTLAPLHHSVQVVIAKMECAAAILASIPLISV